MRATEQQSSESSKGGVEEDSFSWIEHYCMLLLLQMDGKSLSSCCELYPLSLHPGDLYSNLHTNLYTLAQVLCDGSESIKSWLTSIPGILTSAQSARKQVCRPLSVRQLYAVSRSSTKHGMNGSLTCASYAQQMVHILLRYLYHRSSRTFNSP